MRRNKYQYPNEYKDDESMEVLEKSFKIISAIKNHNQPGLHKGLKKIQKLLGFFDSNEEFKLSHPNAKKNVINYLKCALANVVLQEKKIAKVFNAIFKQLTNIDEKIENDIIYFIGKSIIEKDDPAYILNLFQQADLKDKKDFTKLLKGWAFSDDVLKLLLNDDAFAKEYGLAIQTEPMREAFNSTTLSNNEKAIRHGTIALPSLIRKNGRIKSEENIAIFSRRRFKIALRSLESIKKEQKNLNNSQELIFELIKKYSKSIPLDEELKNKLDSIFEQELKKPKLSNHKAIDKKVNNNFIDKQQIWINTDTRILTVLKHLGYGNNEKTTREDFLTTINNNNIKIPREFEDASSLKLNLSPVRFYKYNENTKKNELDDHGAYYDSSHDDFEKILRKKKEEGATFSHDVEYAKEIKRWIITTHNSIQKSKKTSHSNLPQNNTLTNSPVSIFNNKDKKEEDKPEKLSNTNPNP